MAAIHQTTINLASLAAELEYLEGQRAPAELIKEANQLVEQLRSWIRPAPAEPSMDELIEKAGWIVDELSGYLSEHTPPAA